MHRLLLLRHAKAVRDSGEGDFARALTDRGRADAARMGRALDTKAYIPDLVLCSAAARTVETFELLAPELAKIPRVEFMSGLYLASPKQILHALHKVPDDVRTLMAIGHNPGTEDIAAKLARKPQSAQESERLADLREKYPTCALTVLDFDVKDWSDVATGAGALIEFIKPRELD